MLILSEDLFITTIDNKIISLDTHNTNTGTEDDEPPTETETPHSQPDHQSNTITRTTVMD